MLSHLSTLGPVTAVEAPRPGGCDRQPAAGATEGGGVCVPGQGPTYATHPPNTDTAYQHAGTACVTQQVNQRYVRLYKCKCFATSSILYLYLIQHCAHLIIRISLMFTSKL